MPVLFPDLPPWTAASLAFEFEDAWPELDDGALESELPLLLEQKLGPFLLRGLRRRSGVRPDLLARVQADVAVRVARSRRTARTGAAVTKHLREAGTEAVVMKGPAIAPWYREPLSRTWTDADILVSPACFDRALAELRAAGWEELTSSRQPHAWFNRRCREGVNLAIDRYTSVDLHHRVAPWVWSSRLMTVRGRPGGQALRMADPEAAATDNLAISALQLIADHRQPGDKLIAWRDLAELGRALDPAPAAQRLAATGTAGLVGALLRQLPACMRPGELVSLLPDRPERGRRLLAMVAAARSGHYATAHLLRLPLFNAALFVTGTVFPSRGFLRAVAPGQDHPRRWWATRLLHGGLDHIAPGGAPDPPRRLRSSAGDETLFLVADAVNAAAEPLTRGGLTVVTGRGDSFQIRASDIPLWHALADGVSHGDLTAVVAELDGDTAERASIRAITFLVEMEFKGLARRL